MTKRLLALLAVLTLVVAACGGSNSADTTEASTTTTTEAATTTTTEAMTTTTAMMETIGTADNPIQVLFVPSVAAEDIIAGGDVLKQTLENATGLVFEVGVPTSYAATVEEICAARDRTIGFIPAQAYVLANDLCGVNIALKAKRFGYTEYWAEYLVPRDSSAQSLEDLAGLTWAYPDAGSTSGYLVPSGTFANMGITPGDEVEAGGHTAVVRAVYNGEADFGTAYFSPATDSSGNPLWDGTSAGADVPADLIDSCGLDADGHVACGTDYIVRDARANIGEENPDVIQKVRILAVSDPIPNDGVAFGPDFPADLQTQIVDAITAFAADDPEGFATAFDAYSWNGVAVATDSDYDAIRAIVQALGITVNDLG